MRRLVKPVVNLLARLDPRFYYKSEIRWCNDLEWTKKYQPYLSRDGRGGRRILDRRFTIVQMASTVRDLSGSTAECGVARGVGSAMILITLAETYRDCEMHLGFDSFEGVGEPNEKDRMRNGRHHWFKGKLSHSLELVSQYMSAFSRCSLVKGWIPETFGAYANHRFRMVHIDVDLHDPTRDSLTFFYPRMVSGGIILLDDHGFVNCPGARLAAETFFADKPEKLIELPTGQAFVIKGSSRDNDFLPS